MRHVFRAEAVGVVMAMKPVLKLPLTKSGWASKALWKGMLLLMPRITKPFRASRILAMASLRSFPCTMSLAIIES